MPRYVDVENISKLFNEEYNKTQKLISDGKYFLDNLAEGFTEANRIIRNMPTADVVEVKHGKWIETDSFDYHKTPIYICSNCQKEIADNYIKPHKYCLHCGAKMDEKEEE